MGELLGFVLILMFVLPVVWFVAEGYAHKRWKEGGGAFLPTPDRQTPTAYRPRRPPIPRAVKQAVFDRDGGRCVQCGSAHKIHFDHIIPFSKGGSDTEENLQILCQTCNLRKGANL